MAKTHPHPVTLRDVAKLAGCSIKTVSRVVNNQGEISEATRRRIQSAIEKSGYRPNILARSLVNRRTDTLAVVAWGIDYFGPSRAVLGIEQQASERGYSLLLSLIPQADRSDVRPILDMLAARRVDGIIWAVPEVGDNRNWVQADWLKQLPPIVFLSMAKRSGLTIIATDNRQGAIQATCHLIQQNRKKIAVINGPLRWWEARERFEGWKASCLEAGLDVDASSITEGDWTAQSGEKCMRRLLAQVPNIDAVFVGNDEMALGAIGVAHSLGRQIPQDIAIVGFDDTPDSAYFWPPLTTVDQHMIDAGRIAVQSLHSLIEARRSEQNVKPSFTSLAPELVIRASSLFTLEPLVQVNVS